MKNVIIGTLIVFITSVTSFYYLTNSLSSELNKKTDEYKSKIGQRIVIEKDTLTVVDYSIVMETFTLSNGKQVNSVIVFGNKAK